MNKCMRNWKQNFSMASDTGSRPKKKQKSNSRIPDFTNRPSKKNFSLPPSARVKSLPTANYSRRPKSSAGWKNDIRPPCEAWLCVLSACFSLNWDFPVSILIMGMSMQWKRYRIWLMNLWGCVEIDLNTETPSYRVLYFIHIQQIFSVALCLRVSFFVFWYTFVYFGNLYGEDGAI